VNANENRRLVIFGEREEKPLLRPKKPQTNPGASHLKKVKHNATSIKNQKENGLTTIIRKEVKMKTAAKTRRSVTRGHRVYSRFAVALSICIFVGPGPCQAPSSDHL